MATELVIVIVVNAVSVVVGFFMILRSSEKNTCELIEKAKQEAKAMHDIQESRIGKAESKAEHIESNYNAKFEKVYFGIRELERSLMDKLHDTEMSLRSSNHTLAENMSKATQRIELLLAKILPGES